MKRRSRKPGRGVKNFSLIVAAIKEVKIENKSIHHVARSYNITKSSLARYISKLDKKIPNITQVNDDVLAAVLKKICAYGPPTFGGTMRRPPTPEPTASHSNLPNFNRHTVKNFFENYNDIFGKIDLDAASIWNMDEIGFSNSPRKIGKISTLKRLKLIYDEDDYDFEDDDTIATKERGSLLTVALAISASGNSIPPFYVFPKKYMLFAIRDKTDGSIGVANKSGWLLQAQFLKFIKHFIKYTRASKEIPTLLFLEQHESHYSFEAINLAVENGVTIIAYPSSCSKRMQPLNAAVYSPLKKIYASQCSAWPLNNPGKSMELYHIPEIVEKCLDIALTPRNIKHGFKSTGIWPFNSNVFTDYQFLTAEVSEENDSSEEEVRDERFTLIRRPYTPVRRHKIVFIEENSQEATKEEEKPTTAPATKQNATTTAAASKTQATTTAAATNTKPMAKSLQQNLANKRQNSEEKFCIICMQTMPPILNRRNCIQCNSCQIPVHLKCANMTTGFYTCKHCDSDDSD